ncbi:MAG TPA: PilZ domain-containing protein [Candidatus Acidoferrum sp.]|nr:PilZ domain-containing protein [Candidatus Acidoferrum sp.]
MDSETVAENSKISLRRFPRIATPHGLWVAWQREGVPGADQTVSRVRDLNLGGLYILTNQPLLAGDAVSLLFSVAEGEIRGTAVVRNLNPGEGMGVQFSDLSEDNRVRFESLVARLLKTHDARENDE